MFAQPVRLLAGTGAKLEYRLPAREMGSGRRSSTRWRPLFGLAVSVQTIKKCLKSASLVAESASGVWVRGSHGVSGNSTFAYLPSNDVDLVGTG